MDGVQVSGGAQPKDVREAALFLLNASDADAGLRRVLRFAGWLAELAAVMGDARLRDSLATWTRSIATRNDIDPASCRPPARPAADDTPVLLVELVPATPERFTVRLWLATGDSEYEPLDWDTELCLLDDLRARLDEVIGFASRELSNAGAEGAPAVEFLLSVDNIHQAVDWWDIGSSSILPRPLGAVYKVVVRRQRDNDTERHNWRVRWKAVKGASARRSSWPYGWMTLPSTSRASGISSPPMTASSSHRSTATCDAWSASHSTWACLWRSVYAATRPPPLRSCPR